MFRPGIHGKTRRRRQAPAILSELVSAQSRRWRFQTLFRLEHIRQKWPQAAGEYVAQHVFPVRLIRKTLRVSVADASWGNEMSYLSATILERLQELIPAGWVEEIHVVAGGDFAPPPPVRKPVKLAEKTPAMAEKAKSVAKGLEPEIEDAFTRAMLTCLRRRAANPDEFEKK